jgi:2,4-dienoyl-CoA reductase-like NADH-dependent reductase (Old Yellow Enzyme family)
LVDGGWTIEDSISLAKRMKLEGADIIDCSSSGIVPYAKVKAGAGFQVPFSEAVRKGTGILTATVGMITDPMQTDELIRNDRADIVLLGRELLRNPYWPFNAARAVAQADKVFVPPQYWRAIPGGSNRKG